MNLEHVSVEDGKFRRQHYPPERNKSTPFSRRERQSSSDRGLSNREIIRAKLAKLGDALDWPDVRS